MAWKKYGPYAALLVLFILIYDVWFWNDPRLLLGLPIGLTYHILLAFASAGVLALLVAWSGFFDERDEDGDS